MMREEGTEENREEADRRYIVQEADQSIHLPSSPKTNFCTREKGAKERMRSKGRSVMIEAKESKSDSFCFIGLM